MNYKPAVLSFILHLLLLVLAVWLIRGKSPSGFGGEELRRTAVLLARVEDNQTEYLSENDVEFEQERETATTEPVSENRIPEIIEFSEPSSLDSRPSTMMDLNSLDAGAMVESGDGAGKGLEASLSQADLEFIAKEQREMAARGTPPPAVSTSIFGSGPLTGTRFVFLIDRSSSMGADGLGVLPRASEELMSALQALDEQHMFQVVAYHRETVVVDRRSMLAATPANARLARDFLDHLAAFGATNHTGGLYSSLALQPDVLVLMSDGGYPELHDGEINAIVRTTRRKTTIHCVQFGSSDIAPANSFMERLALASGGTYRYVDIKQWRK